MQPLGFLKSAKGKDAEPIYCCSSAEPQASPGAYKVHNDPNRDLHESIFMSFMNFVIRRQRQATLLQLARSHVEELTEIDYFQATSALDDIAGTMSTSSTFTPRADSLDNLAHLTYPTDHTSSHNDLADASPGTSHQAQSGVSAFQAPSPTASHPSVLQNPIASLQAANTTPQYTTSYIDVLSASLADSTQLGTGNTTPSLSGLASLAITGRSLGSDLASNLPENDPSSQTVSPPEPLTNQISPPSGGSNLSTQSNQQPYTQGCTVPTRFTAPVRLSVTAQPFVPGMGRGLMLSGIPLLVNQTNSSNTTTLPTSYEGFQRSGALAGVAITSQHAARQERGTSGLQNRGGSSTNPDSQALFGQLGQSTQTDLPASTTLPAITYTSNTSQQVGATGHAAVVDTLRGEHLTSPEQVPAPASGTYSMQALEKETQDLISNSRTDPLAELQQQTNAWLSENMPSNPTPRNDQSTHTTHSTLPIRPVFGNHQPVSPSILPSIGASSSVRHNAFISAQSTPVNPAVQPRAMLATSSQATAVPYNAPVHTRALPRSSASSWRTQALAASSSSSMARSQQYVANTSASLLHQRPMARNQNQYTPASIQPRTVASSSRQPQEQRVPQPHIVFDLAEAENNPLTNSTSYVIHLTSRLDYGPVISHRYFVCPRDLNGDWVELTLFQWWCRGEQFKMRAEKWDVKCKKHNKFFRMTLRPNLEMREDLRPSFGNGKAPQME